MEARLKNRNHQPLSNYLGDYIKYFKKDIDFIWHQFDYDRNGMLDKAECKDFLDELKKCMLPERAKNY